jgi:hypothetical protein
VPHGSLPGMQIFVGRIRIGFAKLCPVAGNRSIEATPLAAP